MKDNLFEMLMHLFETSLTQLQQTCLDEEKNALSEDGAEQVPSDEYTLRIRPAKPTSTRVMAHEEQMRMTKASYQFLMRMKRWEIFDAEVFELVMNQFLCSDSHIITLEETKWTIRNILATGLNEEQLSFLDLVLYQTEDCFTAQ